MSPRAGLCAALAALALAAAGAAPLSASPPTLTLAQAARLALEQHPSVAAARSEREAAGAESAEARALFRPTVTFSASATQFEEPALVSPIHGFRLDLFPQFSRTLLSPRLAAAYTLFDGGVRQARARQSEAQVAGATAQISAAEQELVAAVAHNYLTVLSLAEVLGADQARLAALDAERRRAGELVESGKAAALEQYRAEAAHASAEAEQAVRAARLDQAERSLARLTGQEVEAVRSARLAPVAATLPVLEERAVLEARALAESPAVAAAQARIAAAEATVAAARAGKRPTVQLAGQEIGYGSGEGDFSAEWNAGVSLTWPLLTGGAVAARVARAEAALATAREALRSVELAVRGEIDAALAAVAEAEARTESLGAAVASFTEVVRVEQLRLSAEAGTQNDYLDAEADLLTARAARAEARTALALARVELARAAGELDLGWLERNLAPPLSSIPLSSAAETPP